MTSWRDRKYAGQGNRRPRNVPPQPRHADDGHCHCGTLKHALATGQVTTITTWAGPDGQPHPIEDEDTARKVKNRAYSCGAQAGVSLAMSDPGLGIIQLGGGRWGFRFRPVDPASAKAHVDGKRARGEQLAYEHVKGEQRPRAPRKGKKQIEAEAVQAHRPLVAAMRHTIDPDSTTDPGPPPPAPPSPPGHDAITGRRIRPGEHPVTTPTGEQLGTQAQVLMELMRGKIEQDTRTDAIIHGRAPATGQAAPAATYAIGQLRDLISEADRRLARLRRR
jgi:hypothetical protein